jgi:hypothetical protein
VATNFGRAKALLGRDVVDLLREGRWKKGDESWKKKVESWKI